MAISLSRFPSTLALLAVLAASSGAQEITPEEKDFYSTRVLTAVSPRLSGKVVDIRATSTLRGVLSISVLDTNVASISYRKKARTARRDRATDYIDLVAVDLNRTASGVRVELRSPNPAPWEEPDYAFVEAELVVPTGSRVQIDAVYFDIVAAGPLAEVVNSGSLGRLDVSRVSERVDLTTANRRLTVEDVSGSVSLQTTNSTLAARNLHDLSGAASFRNEGGETQIESCHGDVNIRSEFGRIEVNDLHTGSERTHIRSLLGPIVLRVASFGEGQLVLSNRDEDIELTVPGNLSSQVSLAVEEGGRIEISDLLFTTELVQPNRVALRSGEGSGLISCSVRGKGNIYLWGSSQGD